MAGTPIEIVFIADDGYTAPLHAAIASVAASARSPVRVHVISTQGDAAARRTQALLRASRMPARFIGRADVAAQLARRHALSGGFLQNTLYHKLLLPELLADLDRVLYLDGDLIVRHDLQPFWSVDVAGALLAAVEDASFVGAGHAAFLAAHGGRYFNAGVMLINLAAWRAEDVPGAFQDWRRFYDRAEHAPPWIPFWDQSPLNQAVAGRWVRVSPRWNFWPSFIPRIMAGGTGLSPEAFAACVGATVEELQRAEDDPGVFHFAGGHAKPWLPEHASNSSPWYAAYREHAAQAQRLIDDELARSGAPLRPAERIAGLAGLTAVLHERLSARRHPVRLLQIGAQDGRDLYRDALRSHAWHGVLVEPVGHLAAKARETYAGCHGVVLREVAASAADGRGVFYAVKAIDPPPTDWFDGASSFEIGSLSARAEALPDFPGMIEQVLIETRSLDTLIAEHDFVPDVISLSAEGHEAKVLSGLDLRAWRPAAIRMDVRFLDAPDFAGVAFKLKRAGYVAARDETHLVAFLPSVLEPHALGALAADPVGFTFV